MILSDRLELLYWSNRLAELPSVTLVLILAAGLIFLLYGRSLFKLIVTLNAAILAGAIGWLLGESVQRPMLVAIGFAVVFGILAWPLFKFGLALLFGLAGSILSLRIVSLLAPDSPAYWPAAAVIGFIFFAVVGFFLVMFAVTMFTTFEGATLIVLPMLILVDRVGFDVSGRFGISLDRVGPAHAAILILGLLGMLYQLGIGHRAEKKPRMPIEPSKKK